VSKNTSETHSFPHGTKSLLTSVICHISHYILVIKKSNEEMVNILFFGLQIDNHLIWKNCIEQPIH